VPLEAVPETKIEIAHVLMMDVVAYSSLLITEQTCVLEELARTVKSAPRFQRAEAAGKLIRIPTGDGMLLVFFDDAQAPIECAIEVARALRSVPQLQLRMGINSGPVNQIVDVNERVNVAGAGVDMAQRVMDCGDAGHILLSKRVADDLAPFPRWNSHLHEVGECEVKHGRRLSLVNFYTDEVGNPQAPRKCTQNAAGPLPANKKSIAVLPFDNLSPDPENAYFADGIQEEILTRLCKIRELKVVSRTSTQSYRGATTNVRAIAQQLGVAHVVEGSVRKAGDQVRVHVQLISAADEVHLWAERYDRKLTDIFAVETEIAGNIAEALQARLTGAEQQAIASRPTDNAEAHQLYLKGLYYWNKFFAPNFDKSREYFECAIELDPNYALAYAGLSVYYAFAAANGLMDAEVGWPPAIAAVEKALSLDPNLAEAYNPLAAVKLYHDRDWPAAERAFRRGIELNPNFGEIHQHYALCLMSFNRREEALAQMASGLEFEPLSPRFHVNWARYLFFTRDYDSAINQFRTTIELDPNYALPHEWLGYTYEQKGMQREAVAEWAKGLTLSGRTGEAALLERVYGQDGFAAAVRAWARKTLEQLDDARSRGQFVSPGAYIVAYVRLGEEERAVCAVEQAFPERSRIVLEVSIDPRLDPLRGNRRFAELMASLPAEFRVTQSWS
jgi:TolB-like protein/Flp pilus assembly protein TadD